MNSDNQDEITPERRHADRKKLIVDVHFDGGNATGIANTRDISTGGLYMRTNTVFRSGEQIALRLTINGKELVLSGTIAYLDEGRGVGVHFQNLSEEKEELIKNEMEID